jgi:hypothetical protein
VSRGWLVGRRQGWPIRMKSYRIELLYFKNTLYKGLVSTVLANPGRRAVPRGAGRQHRRRCGAGSRRAAGRGGGAAGGGPGGGRGGRRRRRGRGGRWRRRVAVGTGAAAAAAPLHLGASVHPLPAPRGSVAGAVVPAIVPPLARLRASRPRSTAWGSGRTSSLCWPGEVWHLAHVVRAHSERPWGRLPSALQGLVTDLEAAIEYYALSEFNNWLASPADWRLQLHALRHGEDVGFAPGSLGVCTAYGMVPLVS